MSDYLWDKTGEDAEIERLEGLLGGLRYEGDPPDEIEPLRRDWRPIALAAALLLGVGGFVATLPEAGPVFGVTQLEGTSACGSDPVCALGIGDWLETDAETRAQVAIADIGHMDVAPESRLRLLGTSEEEHRLELAQGRIDATVDAPPRLLVVETPAATAVDLGCIYTLEVDESGDGWLTVSAGYVALETDELEVIVPAGAAAPMTTAEGPGLPVFWDAPEALVDAAEAGDILPALDAARPRDTLTLAHALPRVERADRERLLDRIQELAPTARLDRERLLDLDRSALAELNLELEPTWF